MFEVSTQADGINIVQIVILAVQGAMTVVLTLVMFIMKDLRDRIARLEDWVMDAKPRKLG